MKLAQTPVLLLPLCLPTLLSSPAFCAGLPALSVVPDAGTAAVTSEAARWEFPARPLSDDRPLNHLFTLRNTTKATLVIERVAASCDCVQARIGSTSTLPVKVLPGQTVPVSVSLIMRRLVPGTVSRSVWLYLRGGSPAGLRLEMHGIVRDDASSPTTHS